jgi:hypothetical protein
VPANLNVNSLRAAKWAVLIALPVNVSMKKLKINMAQIDWKKNFISSAKRKFQEEIVRYGMQCMKE